MHAIPVRLALLALGLAVIAGATAPAAQPAPGPDYQLWHYTNASDPTKRWKKMNTSKSHAKLHEDGKGVGRTHVHHKYWSKKWTRAETGAIFTVMIVDPLNPDAHPATDPTEEGDMPVFCLYHCAPPWTYVRQDSEYQTLYDWQLSMNTQVTTWECRDCTELCTARELAIAYFTICAEGEAPGGSDEYCRRGVKCGPACVPVCPPAERKHCRLGGWFRSRRGCGQ